MAVSGGVPGLRRVEHVMGMPVLVDVRDDGDAEEAVERAFAVLRWVDAVFSTWKEDSELSRVNRGELAVADASPELGAVLVRCSELREETDGYFDPAAGRTEGVDPAGYVKGWAVERAAEELERAGLRNYAVNAGGDILVRGRAIPELAWRIGIQHPRQPDAVAAVVEAGDLAIATSGDYERGRHVVDPHTGLPPDDVLSVTVVGPELGTADAYATAAFAMGGRTGARWTARLQGYQAMTILADDTVLSTAAFPSV